MVQEFQVLRCFKCQTFQVHQVKKSIKWQCKLCNEKQSVKRNYGVGTGKECRLHVQKLNSIRGEITELTSINPESYNIEEMQLEPNENQGCINPIANSKWFKFEEECIIEEQSPEQCDSSLFGNAEIVLEIPKKIKKSDEKKYKTSFETETNIPTDNKKYKTQFKTEANIPSENKENKSILIDCFKNHIDKENDNIELYNKTFDVKNDLTTLENNQKTEHDIINVKRTHAVPNNSKWAQFIDYSQENEEPNCLENTNSSKNSSFSDSSINKNTLTPDTDGIRISTQKCNQSFKVSDLFEIHKEGEDIDNILDF